MTYYIELGDKYPDPTDLAKRTEVRRFIHMLRESADNFFTPDAARLARVVAEQFEVQAPKPKPEEPLSPGAIVKDADGVRWVSWREEGMAHHERPWQRLELDTDEQRDYRNISAVAVLFNGDPAE